MVEIKGRFIVEADNLEDALNIVYAMIDSEREIRPYSKIKFYTDYTMYPRQDNSEVE